MDTQAQKYRQAAITYLIYGLIYLGGAVYLAESDVAARGGLVWFLVGGLFVLVFPWLIWKEFKWFTRILALLVLVRVVGLVRAIARSEGKTVPLPGKAELPMIYGAVVFLLVAAGTCLMLARAGWDLGARRTKEKQG